MGAIRCALLVILAVLVAHPGVTAAGPNKRAPKKGCFKNANDKRIGVLRNLSWRRTRAAYQAALRRRGLRKAMRVGPRQVKMHRGIRGGHSIKRLPYMKLTRATINGVPGLYMGAGSYWTGRARAPRNREMVTDGKGNFYFVARWPKQVGFTDVVLCGCAPKPCGPYGSGCPACGATMQIVYGPFLASDRFRGETKIVYSSYTLKTRHERGLCNPRRRCPAPPPSMRR